MNDMSPHDQLLRMISGYWLTQAIYVAAKLSLADFLKDGPRAPDDLAAATGTHPLSLRRLLRALASVGIFAETGDGRFSLTPLAQPLRSDLPGSQRALAVMNGEEHYRAYGELLHSVQTGEPGFDKVYGLPVFDYLGQHPEQGAVFDAAMTGVHGAEAAAMVEAYDFSWAATVMDIGGGNGSTLAAVLQRWPKIQGTLFDLPAVVARAKPALAAAGVADRCQTVGGSFFESVPGEKDIYMLRHIIHDWDDEKSQLILRNCRAAIGGRPAKLLVIENVIPAGNAPGFGKLLDLTMLVIPGGLERTEPEYRELFAACGFRLTEIIPTTASVSLIVGEPV
ncbi:MAG: methyltransferase [Pirellulales bacterium]